MDGLLVLKFIAALVFVIALLLLFGWILKRSGMVSTIGGVGQEDKRLQVIEFRPIDHRRKLVLVRRDNVEHLLLLGSQSETVIESGIVSGDKT